jgi:hypothetical protein
MMEEESAHWARVLAVVVGEQCPTEFLDGWGKVELECFFFVPLLKNIIVLGNLLEGAGQTG